MHSNFHTILLYARSLLNVRIRQEKASICATLRFCAASADISRAHGLLVNRRHGGTSLDLEDRSPAAWSLLDVGQEVAVSAILI